MLATASHRARVNCKTALSAPSTESLKIIRTPQFKGATDEAETRSKASARGQTTSAFQIHGSGKGGATITTIKETTATAAARSRSTLMEPTAASKAKLEQAAELRAHIASQ